MMPVYEVHTHEMHAYEVHAHNAHVLAYEMHAHEMLSGINVGLPMLHAGITALRDEKAPTRRTRHQLLT
jgi:hypothetical protein